MVDSVTAGYEAFTNEAPATDPASGFKALDELVQKLTKAEAEVASLEEKLKLRKKELNTLSEHEIPKLMEDMNVTEFTTASGFKIKIDEKLRVSIAGDKKGPAVAWLVVNGHSDILSRSVQVDFTVGEERLSQELLAKLREEHPGAHEEVAVNTQTLAALLRQRLAEGKDVPLPLFGGYIQKTTKVTQAKSK